MSIGICDATLAINTLALALALISVGLAWFNKTRASLLCMAVTLVMQSIAIARPGCATILDLRNVPGIGQRRTQQGRPKTGEACFSVGQAEQGARSGAATRRS
jgi:hypothetical protein